MLEEVLRVALLHQQLMHLVELPLQVAAAVAVLVVEEQALQELLLFVIK